MAPSQEDKMRFDVKNSPLGRGGVSKWGKYECVRSCVKHVEICCRDVSIILCMRYTRVCTHFVTHEFTHVRILFYISCVNTYTHKPTRITKSRHNNTSRTEYTQGKNPIGNDNASGFKGLERIFFLSTPKGKQAPSQG